MAFRFLVRLPTKLLGRTIVLGGGGTYLFTKTYNSNLSLSFYGKTKEWEKELNKDLGFDLGEIGSLGMEFMIKMAFKNNYFRPELAANELIEKYPKLHLGYTFMSLYYKDHNEPQKMLEYLNKSQKVAETFPEENRKLNFPVPSREGIEEIPWPITRKEVVRNKLWYIASPFENKGKYLDLAGYVFKKKDGSVVIVNPVTFDEENLKFIKSLGEVSAVVSPCVGHMDCWKECMNHFPKAEFYHVQEQKDLPPNIDVKLLKAEENPFEGDLDMVRMQGHLFRETMFIHKESKTLLGPIDMLIPTGGYKAYGFHIYALAMGLNRGYKETEPYALQCYHHVFVTDREKLRASVKKLLSYNVETTLHGHGGYNDGIVQKGGNQALQKVYSPYLDDSVTPTYLDRFYFFWKFFGKMRLSRELWAKFS